MSAGGAQDLAHCLECLNTEDNDELFDEAEEELFDEDEDEDELFDEDDEQDDSSIDEEYFKFVMETRKHQKERDEAKTKAEEKDEYYKDMSEVNTLMEINTVEAPRSVGNSLATRLKQHQDKMRAYYGNEQLEAIQSLQLHIDNRFQNECTKRDPPYWPVIPINMNFYLSLCKTNQQEGS